MIQPPKRKVLPTEANLYFFYTNWCGFSQKAMPEWTKIEEKLKRDGYFGKTHVKPVSVDCEADKAMCALYDVQGYPTVLLETKSGLFEYNKGVTYSTILAFLRETLGQERENL
jgi:thiol-disulfide isomerase/thioredoxin